MKNSLKIELKIEKIESLLKEIKEDLQNILKSDEKAEKIKKEPKLVYDDEKLKSRYAELYQDYLDGKGTEIEHFINSINIDQLKEFCKINSIAFKKSKKKTVEEIYRWFSEKKAIEKGIS